MRYYYYVAELGISPDYFHTSGTISTEDSLFPVISCILELRSRYKESCSKIRIIYSTEISYEEYELSKTL